MRQIILITLFSALSLFAAGEFVTYKVDGKTYESYYSSPSKNAPLVFMVHDWDGITDYEIKRAQMLYDLGYATFAVDLYGQGVKPQTIQEKKALTSALYQDRDKMRKLLYAGLEQAQQKKANTNNAIGMGYCFGGTAILEFARSGAKLKSFMPFHGGLQTPQGQDYSKTNGDIIVFHGSADQAVSMTDFANLTMELEDAHISHEMITYSSAPHAFSVFGSQRYHKRADEASWKRFTELLEEKLK